MGNVQPWKHGFGQNAPIALMELKYLLTIICTCTIYCTDDKWRLPMAHVSYTELRGNLKGYMDRVCKSRAPLLVTRQNAPGVVMVSEDEYEGIMETVHLLSSPANAARLLESIAQANSGELTEL